MLAARDLPQTPPGELTTLPQTSNSDPRRLAPVALATYTIRAFGARPALRCPNYVTLPLEFHVQNVKFSVEIPWDAV